MTINSPPPKRNPLINDNPQLQSYYASLESRIGYRLFLGDTRHFAYYPHDTLWPFPIGAALRRMEDKLAASLNLPPGAQVLDAGCGVGHVAIHLARQHGLRVRGIDVVERHVEKARRNVHRSGLSEKQVSVSRMDYHHMESVEDESFDGVCTMETLVHATDPEKVLANYYRILRPGGHLTLFEYDHQLLQDSPNNLATSMRQINEYAAMPTNAISHPGVFKRMVEEAGFTTVQVEDLSENIKPLTRLFYVVAYVPWLFITLFHLEKYFINTVTGVEAYRGRGKWRYVTVSATKPGDPIEVAKTR